MGARGRRSVRRKAALARKPQAARTEWALWEVFVQEKTGQPHEHAGSVHAPDAELALENARDTYARRGPVTSLWVVEARHISSTTPDDSPFLLGPGPAKLYRHPRFYKGAKE
ncbi:MAG TPA: 1,2-phenylacetyl-CoA epoxidase subunit PaaB [Myxococcota bacterium]|nr:1,2-phenylacetyl-CoA epoxidase subunit PaaB [Myxococcota bacterium]